MHANRRTFLFGIAGLPAFLSAFSPITLLAQTGDTLRIAAGKPAGDLNPHAYQGLWSVQDLMFEPLVRYSAGGQFLPALATEWQIEDDGKLIRFHLREGVTFQDGTPWDATAMTWNLDRWITNPDNSWLNVGRLFSSYKVVDDHTVEILFKEPVLGLLNEFSYVRPSRFLSPKSVDASGKYQKPVGTGPWIEESATADGSVFTRFDGYWGDKPAFGRLEVKVLPDPRSRMAALRAGDIDITGGDFLAPIKPSEAMILKDAGVEVVVEPGSTTIVAGFNPERNPALADVRVRRAIDIGFDRQTIAEVLFKGLAQPAGNFLPESIPLSGTRFPASVRDVETAKKLLDEAGWVGEGIRQKDGKPLEIELVVSEEQLAGSRSLAEIMQAQLGEVGIGIKIRSVDHASRHSDIPARNYDMALFFTLGAPYEPYGSIIGMLLSTYDNGVDGKLVVDPKNLDPLVEAVMTASAADAPAKTQAVYDWMHNETAFLPLFYNPTIWGHSERVKGFKAPATEYDMPYDGVTIEG